MGSQILEYKNAIVKINNTARDDLFVSKWSIKPAPHWEQVTLISKDFANLPAAGTSVKIETPSEIGSRSFTGNIISIYRKISSDHYHAELIVQHEIKKSLSQTVSGINEKKGTGQFHEESEYTIFDIDKFRQSKNTVALNGKTTHIYSQENDCEPWKIANALNYILSAELDADSPRPTLAELTNTFGNEILHHCDVTGLSLEDALIKIAEKGDALVWNNPVESKICFVKKVSPITDFDIKLQEKGQVLDTSKSNVCELNIKTKEKKPQKGLLVTGDYTRIEGTWELKPGWDTSLSAMDKHYYKRNRNIHFLQRVYDFRKWVLNEAGQYSNLTAYDLSSFDSRFKRKIKRCFYPPVGRHDDKIHFPALIEYKIGTDNWKIFKGSVIAATTECSIYLADERLPLDFLKEAIANNVRVRVTATIYSDVRASEKKSVPNSGSYVRKDFGEKYPSFATTTSSVYQGQGKIEPDNKTPLFLLRDRYVPKVCPNITGQCKLAWIDTSINALSKIKVNVGKSGITANDKIAIKEILHDFQSYSTSIKIEGISNATT